MPTQAQITTAATTLSALQQAQIVALIRSLPRYRDNPGYYPNLIAKVAAATTIEAQQLNAALTLIDAVPHSTVALNGGEKAIDYDEQRDRNWLIDYMISVLYDAPLVRSSVGVAAMKSLVSGCPRCGCASATCLCL